MSNMGQKYLDIGEYGESHWGSWLSGTWVMVLGFLIGQAFAMVLLVGAMVSDPKLAEKMPNAQVDPSTMTFWTILLSIGVVLSIPSMLLLRQNKKNMPWGWLTLISVILGFAGLIGLSVVGNSPEASETGSVLLGHSPFTYGAFLTSFIFPMVFLLFASRLFHSRTATSVITAWRKVRWKRILFAILLTWLVIGSFTFILHITGLSTVKFMFGEYPMSRFLGFAAMSLILIPLQSAAEEIVFRGYLNQAFHKFLKNKWIVFTLTSLMFMAMHLSNPEALAGSEGGFLSHAMVMSGYFLFGFILCVIVYFEGGLEAAIGVHAANNLFAAIFVNYEGSVLPTPSLFLAPATDSDSNLAILFVLSLIALSLYLTRRKQPDFDAKAIVIKPAGQRL